MQSASEIDRLHATPASQHRRFPSNRRVLSTMITRTSSLYLFEILALLCLSGTPALLGDIEDRQAVRAIYILEDICISNFEH